MKAKTLLSSDGAKKSFDAAEVKVGQLWSSSESETERIERIPSLVKDDITSLNGTTNNSHRRVCFIDEVLGISLVTGATHRALTPDCDKSLLYYTSDDYASFILRDLYWKIETDRHISDAKVGWEDLLLPGHDENNVYDYDGYACIKTKRTGEHAMRRNKTLHDLLL